MRTPRWTAAVTAAALTFLLLPSLAAGQVELRVSPRVGILAPLGDYERAVPLEGSTFVSYDELDGMALLGLDFTLSRPGAWWAVQVGGAAGVGGDATGVWDCYEVACPSILIEVPSDVSLMVATGDLVLKPDVGLGALRPFVLGGWGVTRYGFRWDTEVDGFIEPDEVGRTAFATHFGGGARWETSTLGVEVRVEDVVSFPDRPDGGSLHALGVSGSFAYRIF